MAGEFPQLQGSQARANHRVSASLSSLLAACGRRYDPTSDNDRDRAAMINCLKSLIILAAALTASELFAVPALAQALQETPTDIVASQIRRQGFPCTSPKPAVPERQQSMPNAAVWRLQCDEGSYRVTLVPNLAARVELTKDNE
jgi:hypothetical protein